MFWREFSPRGGTSCFPAYADYHRDVKRIPSRYPIPGPFTIGQLDRFIEEQGEGPHVTFHDGAAPFELTGARHG